jgi:hypothetical protein
VNLLNEPVTKFLIVPAFNILYHDAKSATDHHIFDPYVQHLQTYPTLFPGL